VSNTYRHIATHQADSGCTGRERVQNGHNTLEGFGNPAIIPLKSTERSRLVLKHGGGGLDRFAILEFLGEWVTDQWGARLDFVVVQGGLEEGSKRV
jgi:hypothetical protein